MSFKIEVRTDASGQWDGNALRFATEEEAAANALDLWRRWTLVKETRVVESTDPVNYRYVNGELVSVEPTLPSLNRRSLPTCEPTP